MRVFVVDDQRAFRSAAAMIVSLSDGFRVVDEAASGEEALERIGEVHPDLILMDVMMPGIGGLLAAEEIVLRHPDVVVALRANGAEVTDLSILEPDLEEAFVSIMGRR